MGASSRFLFLYKDGGSISSDYGVFRAFLQRFRNLLDILSNTPLWRLTRSVTFTNRWRIKCIFYLLPPRHQILSKTLGLFVYWRRLFLMLLEDCRRVPLTRMRLSLFLHLMRC